MTVNKAGLWGEVFAARFLRDNNYKILVANYRCRMGEIDIIAEKDGITAFVEVKTRGKNAIARPMEAVDYSKQNKLKAAAQYYINNLKEDLAVRFDVVEIILNEDFTLKQINHIENAF